MRALHDRRHRASRGAFVVEGPQAVEAALSRGHVREVYFTEAAAQARADLVHASHAINARVALMTDPVGRAMAQTEHPQGIVAICDLVTRPWMPPEAEQASLMVVLDRVSDPGNAGTIIRTADAAGADAVVFTAGSVDPHNGKCVRATAGSIFHLPIFTDVSAAEVIEAKRVSGAVCLVADAGGEVRLGTQACDDLLSGDVVWIFGNEAHGVDDRVAALADARVSIPIAGAAESLNLAAAAAVCLYASLLSGRRGRNVDDRGL